MKGKLEKILCGSFITMLALSMLLAIPILPAKAATTLEIINPADGTHNFIYDTDTASVGDTFDVNVTVKDILDLFTWQIKVGWDPTVLECTGAILPADHVFAGKSQFAVPPSIDNVAGTLLYGNTLLSPEVGVDVVEGRLAQITFEIIKGPDMMTPTVTSDIIFMSPGGDTFMQDTIGVDISFTPVNGYFEFTWVTPGLPYLEIRPSFIQGLAIGTPVDVEVWARNVRAGWTIVGIQFAIPYNTTLLEYLGYTDGTFMQAFANGGESVFSTVQGDINDFLNPDFKAAIGTVYILPSNTTDPPGQWVDPFPDGDGKLLTMHFNPVLETIFPDEELMDLLFRDVYIDVFGNKFDGILFMNKFGDEVDYTTARTAVYRAPQKTLGPYMDVYTQYDDPYGGQGLHMPSDMFAPQELVVLCALVQYNLAPVPGKIVVFQIESPTGFYNFTLSAMTSGEGLACVSFTVPWLDESVFGIWDVTATVDLGGTVVNDTLRFHVDYYIRATVLAIGDPYSQGAMMSFKVTYTTYSMQMKPLVTAIVAKDELGFPIGDLYSFGTFGKGAYDAETFCEPLTWETTYDIDMHDWAFVGANAVVEVNLLNMLPEAGGVAYCPRSRDYFGIKYP